MGWATVCRLTVGCGLIAVVGCSPSADDQRAEEQAAAVAAFAPAFGSITSDYQTAMSDIRSNGRQALTGDDANAVLDIYKSLRDASAEAAEGFAEITPPAAVAGQHQSLVDNLRQQADTLDAIVTAAAAQQDAVLTDGLTRLATLLADFTTIHQAIDQELAQGP